MFCHVNVPRKYTQGNGGKGQALWQMYIAAIIPSDLRDDYQALHEEPFTSGAMYVVPPRSQYHRALAARQWWAQSNKRTGNMYIGMQRYF